MCYLFHLMVTDFFTENHKGKEENLHDLGFKFSITVIISNILCLYIHVCSSETMCSQVDAKLGALWLPYHCLLHLFLSHTPALTVWKGGKQTKEASACSRTLSTEFRLTPQERYSCIYI